MGFSNPSFVDLRDGRKLAYLLIDPDTSSTTKAPIVLLSNPLGASYHVWQHFVDRLRQHNFRILLYDQIGHGQSTVNPSTVEETTFVTLAEDVRQLLIYLKVVRLYAWVGISMGASTAIQFCNQYPLLIERLVICDTVSCSPVASGLADPFGPRAAAARSAGNLDAITQGTLERWFSESWRTANPGELERMRSLMVTTKVEGFAACCAALKRMDFDLRPYFSQMGTIADDILLVVGELDANLPQTMAAMREEMQQSIIVHGRTDVLRLAVIKNAGHVSFIDGLDEFASIVIGFLTAP